MWIKACFIVNNMFLWNDSFNRTAPSSAKTSIPVSPNTGNSRFPRGTASRSTFHGGPIRERRHGSTTYNGPGGVPSHTQDTSAMGQGRMSFFNKLTSKFSRRYVLLKPCLRVLTKIPASPSTSFIVIPVFKKEASTFMCKSVVHIDKDLYCQLLYIYPILRECIFSGLPYNWRGAYIQLWELTRCPPSSPPTFYI